MSERRDEARPATFRPGRGPGGHGHGTKIEQARDVRATFQRLLTYFRPYKGSLLAVIVLMVIYAGSGLVGPILLGVAIDRIMLGSNMATLAQLVGFMAGSYAVSWLAQIVAGRITARISQFALREIRRDLFEQLQLLSLDYFDRNRAGDLMSRLTNDIDAINRAVSQNLTALISNLLILVGIVLAMLVLNVWLALATILLIPLISALTGLIAGRTRRGYRKLQKELGRLNAIMEETISGQRVVNAFGRNERAIRSFTENNDAVYESAIYAQTFALMLMPLTHVMGNLIIVVLAALGSWLAILNLATVGTIATFIAYGRRLLQPVRQLANIYNTIQAAFAGAERVFELIDERPTLQDVPDAQVLDEIRGEVSFDHVHFSYKTGVPVLKDVSLKADPGQTIALVGPTGAGKTTIINLLTRFYDVDQGSIRIDGFDLRQLDRSNLRRQLGIVLQDTFLFSDTVMENIRYGRLNATDDDVVEAARVADADFFIRQLPDGYDTPLSERGSNLSQGQRQLLAIARAILADPKILILDEATSSVDTRTELRIQRALLRLMEGRTSFVIAHRLSTIRDADMVMVVNDGEIIERGTHEALLAMGGFYHKLYMSQFRRKAA
jgi:ATP-binding cassette subfamily B multidrug efflux pump